MNAGSISIQVGGAGCNSAVVTRMAHVTVVQVAEKTFQVKSDDGRLCWLPLKGVVKKGEYYVLASWFRRAINGYQWRFLQDVSTINGVSVS